MTYVVNESCIKCKLMDCVENSVSLSDVFVPRRSRLPERGSMPGACGRKS